MKNFLQVNRAPVAKKTNLLNKLSNGMKKGLSKSQVGTKSSELPGLLFSQSLGTVGGPNQTGVKKPIDFWLRKGRLAGSHSRPRMSRTMIKHYMCANQTGETLTRENRIGLMSYLRRTLMLLFAILVMSMANIGTAWGTVATFSGSNLNAAAGDKTVGSITLSTSNMTYSSGLYYGGAGGRFTLTASGGATISQVLITMSGSNNRYTAANITNCTSCTKNGSVYTCTISPATSTVTCQNNGGGVTITQLDVTYSGGASTKRIYMKAGEWNNDSPYFYAHSWGSSNSDVLMTLADCETDVYYADIPSGNTSVLFTRQSTNSGIKYKNETGNWNQSDDITISTNDKFTFNSWDGGSDGKSTFTSGTYSAPTYTITYAAGGGTGSMTATSGIACGADQALPANSFTKSGYVFAGWHADVATTVSGSPVAAGSDIADEATLQNITSNITLTAQWEERSCPVSGTVYSLTMKSATLSGVTQNTEVALATTYATDDGGTSYLGNLNATAGKAQVSTEGSGTVYFNGNDAYIKIVLDCPIQTGDELTFTNGSGNRQICITTSTTRATTYTTSSNSYTFPAAFNNVSTIYVWRSSSNGTYLHSLTITRTASCGATQPGEIGKGSLSNCSITLTAANSPAANNTWYWQSASDGTATNLGSGATKSVSTPGTYYIRSYFSTGSCWSDARSVTVTEGDLTPAAPTSLTAASTTAKGTTFTVTGAGTSNFEFYVSTESTAPVAGTGATYSAASTTKTIDDKVAGTTYYAWVRAVCGSYKSAWTALTGNTFTTSTVTMTPTLTNVTKSSGAESGIGGSDYTAVFAADAGYCLPSTITVTIDGNTATVDEDYTWADGTLTIPANKINGNIAVTVSSPAAAPTNVAISGTYHYYPGETISLTATATGGNGPKTYQWYHGGTADGDAIEGATSATYSKASCVVGDAGSYYCKVTCGGSASRWSDGATQKTAFNVKIMQFHLKNSGGSTISTHALTKVDATHATLSLSLTGGTTYKFRVTDGCNNWYGNTGEMTSSNCTDWHMDADADCRVTTSTKSATYTFNFDFTDGLLGSEMKVSVVYPSGDQASGKVIYWDNSVLNWDAGDQWYRIGKGTHNNKTQMSLVPGTANLYKVTTTEYNGFEYWHIANNEGEGTGNIFWTKDSDPTTDEEITEAMGFEGSPVTADAVTITPQADHHGTGSSSDNDNCEFYEYDTQTGMKTDRVTISSYSNGTITVNYVNTSGSATSFTSGYADLAHTVVLTSITAVPNTGYDASAITINEGAYSANYVVTGATTIAASFSLHNYNVTYNTPSNGNYTIKVASGSASSASKTATMGQTITLAATPSTGYHFTGWTITNTDNSTDITNSVSLSGQTENATFTMPAANISIVATFAINTYTVSFAASPAGYGSVSPTSIVGVNHGSTVSIASNVLTLKATNVTATPTSAGADYTYSFSGWSVSNGASITEAQTITANFTRTANQYSVTHTLTGVTTSTGATGANAATYGTNYTATFAASSGYELPNSVTVTAGGSDITANCTYTKGTGTVVIPGASITGNIVITVTGTYAANFQMIADASAGSEKSLSNGEAITQGSKNCTTLTGGTAVYTGPGMKVQKGSPYGWYFGSNSDVITITLTGHILQVGSVIAIDGNCGSSNNGIKINTNGIVKTGESSGGEFSGTYTVKAGDTDLIGTNVLTLTRSTGSATRMYSITLSNCQAATPCTTPTLPSLSNQAGCSYSAWNATPSNASTISAAGESISYSWKKGATEKATTASYTPDADGTDYTVTVTVSKAGKISTSVTSSALTATKYGNPTVTGPSSDAEYEVGDVATNLSVTATPDHGESLTYQWYSNTAKSTTTPTPTALENCTTSTYKPSTAAAATTYYFCKVSGGCADVYSSIATVTVNEASCFKITDAGKNGSSWPKSSGNTIANSDIDGTITGGSVTYSGSGSLTGNDTHGIIFDNDNDELTITLSGSNVLVAGSVITIVQHGNSGTSKETGFKVSGNSMSPATCNNGSTTYKEMTQTYTVVAADGIAGTKSFTIKWTGTNQVYLKSITVTGCVECTPITPSLSYSKTTIWMDDALTATPTLTGYYGTPTISYASSDPTVVRVDNSSTGAITALKRGTATITATIGATTYSATDYCGNTATCEITVKDVSCGEVVLASATRKSGSGSVMENGTGAYYSASGINSETSGKLGSNGHYMYITLTGTTLQDGDVVVINLNTVGGIGDGSIHLFAGTTSGSTEIGTKASPRTGDNEITLSNVPNNTYSVTMYRTGDNQNHRVDGIAVKRYVCPDSKEFLPTGDDGNWNATANWVGETGRGASLPTIDDRVVISKPVTVNIANAKAKDVLVNQYSGATGKVTISAAQALIIAEKMQKTTTGSNRIATAASDVIINSTRAAGVGALIIGGETGTNHATVNFATKAKNDGGWVNQFIGSPFSDNVPYVDYALQLYKFVPRANGDRGWWSTVHEGDEMEEFWGYNVLYNDPSELDVTWTGTLNASTSKTISGLYYNGSSETDNIFANSWTAPIHVGEIEDADLVNASKTLYMFNAGTPAQEEGQSGSNAANTNTSPGTYISIPIHSATYAGIGVIPSMQAFYVEAQAAGASITLDYNKIVYTPALTSVGIVPNRAPKHNAEVVEPDVIKLHVQSETGWGANTYVLGRADFAEGYEDGWDGAYIEGEGATPKLYTPSVDGNMFINCLPQIDGTVVGFRKGSADNNYTFSFGYEGEEEYYLKDLKLDTETRIDNESTYAFTAEPGDNAARFIIVRKTPTITTGVDHIDSEAVSGVRKLIINDKVYIIRGGRVYSVDGAIVK